MLILALFTFEENPAASLIEDGKVLAYAEEERFIRVKNANGYFPLKATQFCLKKCGKTLDDVDEISIGWDYQKYLFKIPLFSFLNYFRYLPTFLFSNSGNFLIEIFSRTPSIIKQKINLELRKISHNDQTKKIVFYKHHLAHAASAFYLSPYKKALVLVMDGSGEECTINVYSGQDKKKALIKLESQKIPNSLGWFYGGFSAFLGFEPYSESGFLMGLAPYGKVDPEIYRQLNKIIVFKNGKIKVSEKYFRFGKHQFSEHFSDQFVKVFGQNRLTSEEITQQHRDLAKTVQFKLEEIVLDYLKFLKDKYSLDNLCLAGGLAQNVKLNGKIKQSALFKNIFVQPISHDAGTSIGAGLLASLKSDKFHFDAMKDVYLGPEFSNQEIEVELKNSKLEYKYFTDQELTKKIAKYLADDKIIAWFQGRMEGGPRALGNRSILASPINPKMPDLVNRQIKYRDPWRPFCPSVIEERANDYFEGIDNEAQYMIVAYQVKEEKKEKIPAVVHVDGSARPQLVKKDVNPLYYQLISDFEKLTGEGVLLNTSLNVKGEPMACFPLDALRCFFSTGIDVLVMNNFVLEKKLQNH